MCSSLLPIQNDVLNKKERIFCFYCFSIDRESVVKNCSVVCPSSPAPAVLAVLNYSNAGNFFCCLFWLNCCLVIVTFYNFSFCWAFAAATAICPNSATLTTISFEHHQEHQIGHRCTYQQHQQHQQSTNEAQFAAYCVVCWSVLGTSLNCTALVKQGTGLKIERRERDQCSVARGIDNYRVAGIQSKQ